MLKFTISPNTSRDSRRLDDDPDGAAAMRRIRETGALDEEAENALKAALTAYTQEFIKNRTK